MLELNGVCAAYGDSQALHGIDLRVRPGELVTLLGRNGAGKTTTLRAIMGLVSRSGRLRFKGQDLAPLAPEQIARLGLGYVPEERGIFAALSVEENLLLPPAVRGRPGMPLAEIYALFPNLRERRAARGTHLSGGEQQMLAMARILRTGADFILLDEPTEGLAPVVVQQIAAAIKRLKADGLTVLLVEQNFHFARAVADRHCVVEEGRVVDVLAAAELADPEVLRRLQGRLGL